MSLREWFRPPRHLIALFLLITLVPSALLIAFGWRLIAQERALQEQQARQRREHTADVIVSALAQAVAASERALGEPSTLAGLSESGDAVAVAATPRGIEAFPPGRLLFYPVAPGGLEAPAHVFAAGETLEHQSRDAAAAAAWYRERARSDDRAVRAGALIRLGRVLGRAGDADGALEALAQVGDSRDVLVAGVPAGLLARFARCTLLEKLGRTPQLREEGARLLADLAAGRWPIDRTAFELHVADATRWAAGRAAPIPPGRLALAEAIEWMWREVQRGRAAGRETRTFNGIALTLLWADRGAARSAALAAGPEFVQRHWLAGVAPLIDAAHDRLTLAERTHRADAAATRRAASDSGLPWTVLIEPVGDADASSPASRARRLWIAGLALLALLVATGTYAVARAVSRELAVARLQTDFVAAVSHEFRTPLTSLRQLTEMLADRPETPIERRREYYGALSRQTERLRRLVESLLDFGRMEAGRAPYRFEPIDAAAFVAAVVRDFEQERAARGVHISLDASTPACVEIDRDALTNALWNLLDNAVKYSPRARAIAVDVRAEDTAVAIAVRDRGIGIPPEERRAIFGKFVRGAQAKRDNIQGTGIGLAMVQHVVTAHGGEIALDSEVGEGSTFTIRLPRSRSGAAAASVA